jgi:hypothetical protein
MIKVVDIAELLNHIGAIQAIQIQIEVFSVNLVDLNTISLDQIFNIGLVIVNLLHGLDILLPQEENFLFVVFKVHIKMLDLLFRIFTLGNFLSE